MRIIIVIIQNYFVSLHCYHNDAIFIEKALLSRCAVKNYDNHRCTSLAVIPLDRIVIHIFY